MKMHCRVMISVCKSQLQTWLPRNQHFPGEIFLGKSGFVILQNHYRNQVCLLHDISENSLLKKTNTKLIISKSMKTYRHGTQRQWSKAEEVSENDLYYCYFECMHVCTICCCVFVRTVDCILLLLSNGHLRLVVK